MIPLRVGRPSDHDHGHNRVENDKCVGEGDNEGGDDDGKGGG